MTVAAILRHKSAETITIAPETLLVDVATLLSRHRIGAVPVMEGDELAGILSERDLVHCLARHEAEADPMDGPPPEILDEASFKAGRAGVAAATPAAYVSCSSTMKWRRSGTASNTPSMLAAVSHRNA